MIEVKNFSGKLNLDDSKDSLPPNDYIDALNITHDAVEEGYDQDITTVVANRIGDSAYTLPSGTNKTIGGYPNTLRNTIIQLLWNSNDYHRIIEFDLTTRLNNTVFENLTDSGDIDVLGFTENEKITSINIFNRDEGDLLFFLDSLGRPTQIDITLFKAGAYTQITRAILDKGKKPPLSPPSVIYDNDTSRRSNNLRNKLFRFKTRWIYDDFEKSTFSPISVVPLPSNILSDIFTNVITNNNVIRMAATSGDENVSAIEITMSYVEKTNNWSDFQSIAVIKKSTLQLQHTTEVIDGTAGSDLALTTFSGIPIQGDVVNAYLTLIPNTRTLVGTYTVLSGDSLSDVATALAASMLSLAIVNVPYSYNEVTIYGWYDAIYAFDEVEIIPSTTNSINNIDFPYSFYNDSTYPVIDIEESIQIYDYVPDIANTQELLNGNILAYAGITEGYDKNTIDNSTIIIGTVAVGDGGVGSLYAVQVFDSENSTKQNTRYDFSGIPLTGTVVELKVKRKSDHTVIVASTYTTLAGDTISDVTFALYNNLTAPNMEVVYNSYSIIAEVEKGTYEAIVGVYYSQLIITPPTSTTANNSIATWKWSSERTIARGYFDEKGKTNGILYTDKVTFPAYAENGSNQPLVPYINYKINDVPPDWAYSMQFYMNKDKTGYIFWESISVNKSEAEYIYFDVTSFTTNATKKPTTAQVNSYTFQDGDRLRLIRNADVPGIVYADTYDAAIEGLVVDPVINSTPTTGSFVKIKNVEPFTTAIDISKDYVIELYRPAQQEAGGVDQNEVYYEFGQQFDIIDPTLSTRRHSGQVTDQEVGVTPAEYDFYDGDAYFRSRTIAVSDVGYATFNAMDRNFVDFYISAVSSIDGRPSIIDTNARRAYYSTLIRHSLAYQANTNENGLNRFYYKNADEYDYSFGAVQRLKVRDRQMRVFQKYKVGSVPLYSSLGKDANGLQVVFQTDKLLNPIDYYIGNVGIGNLKESLQSNNYADYFCDDITGTINRVSNDGVTILSLLYKMNVWANHNLPLRTGNYKVYGAFDRRLNNYIIALEGIICVGVEVPDFTIINAEVDVVFSQSVTVTGSLNFTLANIVKPGWMTISISGYDIVFSGTPSSVDEGTGIVVSFDISNDCGEVSVSKTIDVTTAPCIAVAIVGTPVLPDGSIDTPYTYSFDVTGTAPFNLSAIVKPSWMTIAVNGTTIEFSGTPDVDGTSIPVSFTINNCSGDTANFSDTIDVTAENWIISYANNDPLFDFEVTIGNNNLSPTNIIYDGVYSTDPVSGTDLVNLPAVNANVVLQIHGGTDTLLYATCNGISGTIGIGGGYANWSGINGNLIINFATV